MIRPGTSGDAEGVARVHVETWQAAYAHALPSEQLQALSVEDAVQRHRRRPPGLVADQDGEILGFVDVGASRDPGTDGELFAIYVHPEHSGTGVGRALIDAGEAELRRDTRMRFSGCSTTTRGHAASTSSPAGRRDGAARDIHIFGFDVSEVRYAKSL